VWVCLCEAVTSGSIVEAIGRGARTVKEIGEANGAGTSCGRCARNIHLLIEQELGNSVPENRGERWSRKPRS
jgi:bacterioferritin-associated ferredoxin